MTEPARAYDDIENIKWMPAALGHPDSDERIGQAFNSSAIAITAEAAVWFDIRNYPPQGIVVPHRTELETEDQGGIAIEVGSLQSGLAFPVVHAHNLYTTEDVGGGTTGVCLVPSVDRKVGEATFVTLEKPTCHIQITTAEARKITFEILAEAEDRRIRFSEEEAKRNDIGYE